MSKEQELELLQKQEEPKPEVELTPEQVEEKELSEDLQEEQYGEKVQKRIGQLTHKYRDAERKAKELEESHKATKQEVERMRRDNQELLKTLKSMSEAAEAIKLQTAPQKVDPLVEIDEKIKTIKGKRAEAFDNADFKTAGIMDDQLDDLRDRKYALKLEKEKAELEKKVSSTKPTGDGVDPALTAFIEQNEWIDPSSDKYDPIMSGAAREYHDNFLMKDPTWSMKSPKQRLNEVKRKIEERFNYKPVAPGIGGVEGVGPSPPQAPIDKMSDQEKYVAKRLFPDKTEKEAYRLYGQYK